MVFRGYISIKTTMLEIKWHSCIVRGFLIILNYCIGNYLLCLSSVNIHTLCYDILIHIWTWEYIRVRKVVLTLQTSNYIRHHFSYLLMGFSVNDYSYSCRSVWLIIDKHSSIYQYFRAIILRWPLFNQHLTPRTPCTLFKFFLTGEWLACWFWWCNG